MKMSRRTVSALRAHVTRRARKSFRNAYPTSSLVLELLRAGASEADIIECLDVTKMAIAAVKAHYSREEGKFQVMARMAKY